MAGLGTGGLRRFRGMFAFALLDEHTSELVLARDPFGIKPLYYLPRGDGVVFASELKALVAAVGYELRIRPGALVASMLYYWVPEQQCAIDGVQKLPPGSWPSFRPTERLRRSGTGASRRWRPRPQPVRPPTCGRVIEESVTAHLVADVPVSSFLSGGLDSSIVTVLATRPTPTSTPTRSPSGPRTSGSRPCLTTLSTPGRWRPSYGIKLHEIEISPDIVDLLPRIVDVLDEPIGDPAAINTLLMCEAARGRGVKVILSGMGADELFGGYRKHLACLMASQYQRLPAAPRAMVRSTVKRLPVSVAGRGLRYSAMGEAVPDLRRAGGGATVSPQLHPLWPRRAGRPPQP